MDGWMDKLNLEVTKHLKEYVATEQPTKKDMWYIF